MPTMKVKIKHAGKIHEDLELNTDAPPTAFKQLVYERTGVPLDRMKVMVKGGVLKVSLPFRSWTDSCSESFLDIMCRTTQTGRRSHPKRFVMAAVSLSIYLER